MQKLVMISSLLVVFFCLSACKPQNSTNNEIDKTDSSKIKTNNHQSAINTENESKTLRISANSVVFFMPSNKEINQILEANPSARWEFISLFNSFEKMAVSTCNALSNSGLKAKLSRAQTFEIEMDTGIVIFDKIKEDQLMGHIFSDGKKAPLIGYGLHKNKEFQDLIQMFFGIKDLKNAELDSLENIEQQMKNITNTEGP